jgi:hypothetical protein
MFHKRIKTQHPPKIALRKNKPKLNMKIMKKQTTHAKKESKDDSKIMKMKKKMKQVQQSTQ